MFRVGLYARVSTQDQQTLPLQMRAMREYAATRDWTIVMQVKEVGSGASERELRQKLMEAARRREIDIVLVWRLDRWGQSLPDLVSTLEELNHLGVGFVSLTEALDLTTPTGRAMAGFEPERIGHRGAFPLALDHQPVTGRTSAKLRGCSTAAAHTERKIVACDSVLNIDDANIPLPHMQRVADVQELFLPMQSEFVQSCGSHLSAEAVELLAVDADDVAQVAIPAENRAKDVVEIAELQPVGNRDQTDNHGAHLTENRSKYQA